ncbi:MAG: DUF2330 domain-containing protein [Alphaproteobacteria bacterium]
MIRFLVLFLFICTWLLPAQAHAFCAVPLQAAADSDTATTAPLHCRMIIAGNGEQTRFTLDIAAQPGLAGVLLPVPQGTEIASFARGSYYAVLNFEAYTRPGILRLQDPDPCQANRTQKVMPPVQAQPTHRSLSGTIPLQSAYLQTALGAEDMATEGDLRRALIRQGLKAGTQQLAALVRLAGQGQSFVLLKPTSSNGGLAHYPPISWSRDGWRGDIWLAPLAPARSRMTVVTITPAHVLMPSDVPMLDLPMGPTVPRYVDYGSQDLWRAITKRVLDKQPRTQPVSHIREFAGPALNDCQTCVADLPGPDSFSALGADWAIENVGSIFSAQEEGEEAEPIEEDQVVNQAVLSRFTLFGRTAANPAPVKLVSSSAVQAFHAHVTTHTPWPGSRQSCAAASGYRQQVAVRNHGAARTLSRLTGWKLDAIMQRMRDTGAPIADPAIKPPAPRWYRRLMDRQE